MDIFSFDYAYPDQNSSTNLKNVTVFGFPLSLSLSLSEGEVTPMSVILRNVRGQAKKKKKRRSGSTYLELHLLKSPAVFCGGNLILKFPIFKL